MNANIKNKKVIFSKLKFLILLFTIYCSLFTVYSLVCSAAQIGEEKLLTKGKPPDWITSSKEGEYIGVSQEEDEQKARNEALSDARKQIIDSLGIEMSKEAIREITQSGSVTEIATQQTSAKIKTESVARNILQVKPSQWHIERWQKTLEKGVNYYYKVYVLVKFSKQQHEAFIDSMIQQVEELSDQAMNSAKALSGQGKTVESIVEYFNVANAVRSVNKITGIDPAKLTKIKGLQRDALQPIREFFGQTKVTPLTGPNLSAQMGDDLLTPIKLKFEYKNKSLSGMPVRFTFIEGSGNITNTVITDNDGIALTTVLQIQPAKNKESALIESKPDVDMDETGVPVTRFNIDMSRRILVRVIEKNLGRIQSFSRLENALVQGLVKEKFKCIEPNTANTLIEDNDITSIMNGEDSAIKFISEKGVANWILVGEVTTSESSKIQEGYVFSRANGAVKVIRMDNNQAILSDNSEQKAAGLDYEKAGLKALDGLAQKFSIKVIQNLKEVLK